MKFKVDENLPVEAADLLRSAGHDAVTVSEESLVGVPDSQLIRIRLEEHRVLLTLDLDFSDIRSYPPAALHGLVVLRLYRQDKSHVLEVMRQAPPLFEREQLETRLWIVEEGRIRMRGEER